MVALEHIQLLLSQAQSVPSLSLNQLPLQSLKVWVFFHFSFRSSTELNSNPVDCSDNLDLLMVFPLKQWLCWEFFYSTIAGCSPILCYVVDLCWYSPNLRYAVDLCWYRWSLHLINVEGFSAQHLILIWVLCLIILLLILQLIWFVLDFADWICVYLDSLFVCLISLQIICSDLDFIVWVFYCLKSMLCSYVMFYYVIFMCSTHLICYIHVRLCCSLISFWFFLFFIGFLCVISFLLVSTVLCPC